MSFEKFEHEVTFTPQMLVKLLTQSNVIAAVEQGTQNAQDIANWLLESVAPLFDGETCNFPFRCEVRVLRRAGKNRLKLCGVLRSAFSNPIGVQPKSPMKCPISAVLLLAHDNLIAIEWQHRRGNDFGEELGLPCRNRNRRPVFTDDGSRHRMMQRWPCQPIRPAQFISLSDRFRIDNASTNARATSPTKTGCSIPAPPSPSSPFPK